MDLLKVKATCDDCRIDGFDNTVGCSSCTDTCVECYRYAGACGCTCKNLAFGSCAIFEAIDHCNCIDGSTLPGRKVAGARVGWSDNAELLAVAALTCPDDPHTYWQLWGSQWDFTTHETSTSLDCPTSTTGMDKIPMNGSTDPQVDMTGTSIDGECTTGSVEISLEDLGIETITLGGTGTDCQQEGGREMFLMEIKDGCGNLLVLCPFAGVLGSTEGCELPPGYCCDWLINSVSTEACGNEDGTAHVTITATKTGDCQCEITEFVRLRLNGTDIEDIPFTGAMIVIDRDITHCNPGDVLTLTLFKSYDDPACNSNCVPIGTGFYGSYTL